MNEPCPKCGGTDYAICRDMIGTRKCPCGHSWVPEKKSFPKNIQVNDVVQLNPEHHLVDKNGFFASCFMVVTEVKSWGCQGYIPMPGGRGEMPGMAYYRAKWDEMVKIGKAEWVSEWIRESEK